jgi:uncharacterized protein (DUF2461 family)
MIFKFEDMSMKYLHDLQYKNKKYWILDVISLGLFI